MFWSMKWYLESKGMRVIFQKCIKFENILKKGSLMYVTITCMKQLEYTLYVSWEVHDVKNKLLVELWIIFIICS